MKTYCIEVERGGIREEDCVLHEQFDHEPTKQEIIDFIISQNMGIDDEDTLRRYCRYSFYQVS